jgi:hypothetical protein
MFWRTVKPPTLPDPALSEAASTQRQGHWADSIPAMLGRAREPSSVAPLASESQWKKSCEAYRRQAMQQTPDDIAAKNLSRLHRAVAQTLWEHKSSVSAQEAKRLVHLTSQYLGLVAVFSPVKRLVQVKQIGLALSSEVQPEDLNLRVMPSSAVVLEGHAAQNFEHISWDWLMWQYGQYDLQSLAHMPELSRKLLFLRRFPAFEPHLLQMRHLAWMHALSRQPVYFEELQTLVSAQELPFICPDITSLYLSGALQIRSGH